MSHIVIVDDEPELRDAVRDYLLRHGYAVSEADGGKALDALMAERPVDLAILDINMPGEDGLSIARRLRSGGRIGLLMLTANSSLVDRIVGLEVGADDYLAKPFDLRELLARVRAILRRVGDDDRPSATLGREVSFGRCRLNLDSRKLFDAEGAELHLTAMEFDLLRVFAEHPGKVLSRDRILDLAHNSDMAPFDRSVDSRVVRLRRKLEVDPARPQVLKTVRGQGYVFSPSSGSER